MRKLSKLVKGQTIRIHNDYLGEEEEAETHRILLQLSENWKEDNGGYLMFFIDSKSDQYLILLSQLEVQFKALNFRQSLIMQ